MGLGNNRDYKTRARRVKTNLAKHHALTTAYIGLGLGMEVASALALRMVQTTKKRSKVWRGR
jgi:hypothetical protein